MVATTDTMTVSASPARGVRAFAWVMVSATFAYLIANYLLVWHEVPSPSSLFSGEMLAVVPTTIYALALALPIFMVMRTPETTLRADSARISGIARFIIRAAFWGVFLVGLADAAVSFLRVEEMLAGFVGQETADGWNFNKNRGPELHGPLILLGIVIAALTRSALGFQWLALLVVIAELNIVLFRFIFSYEQAFMGDLVRFWYGALFLFASAYTLLEDGHVRVDVLYAGMRDKTKGFINAWGSIIMGILFCWVILVMGMATKSSIINAPLISFEVSQSGFGMYVKYLMAGFLGVFAVTMMLQFCAYLLESVADWRGEDGSRLHTHDDELPVH
ncbi:MAG: TRAP transporter small permease subunit [Pseudomonadota bacterium]